MTEGCHRHRGDQGKENARGGVLSFQHDTELPRNPTTRSIISRLSSLFSEYGICEVLMSDADPLFRSAEFRNFTEKWEFVHKVSSPQHHQSNGKVEAAVAIIKRIIMTSQEAKNDWRKGLLAYNDTPQQRLGEPRQDKCSCLED